MAATREAIQEIEEGAPKIEISDEQLQQILKQSAETDQHSPNDNCNKSKRLIANALLLLPRNPEHGDIKQRLLAKFFLWDEQLWKESWNAHFEKLDETGKENFLKMFTTCPPDYHPGRSPPGSQVYFPYPLIPECLEEDGFQLGAITDFLQFDRSDGCSTAEFFVQAPDGSRCKLIYECNKEFFVADEEGKQNEVSVVVTDPPDNRIWGTYVVSAPYLFTDLNSVIALWQNMFAKMMRKMYQHYVVEGKR